MGNLQKIVLGNFAKIEWKLNILIEFYSNKL